jgi:hypothetical protein
VRLRKKSLFNPLYSAGCEIFVLFIVAEGVYDIIVGYKGLPLGSVLSPFLYNIIGSCTERFISSGCRFFQYADDLVVYMAHRLFNEAHGLVETSCPSLTGFFSSMVLWA